MQAAFVLPKPQMQTTSTPLTQYQNWGANMVNKVQPDDMARFATLAAVQKPDSLELQNMSGEFDKTMQTIAALAPILQ